MANPHPEGEGRRKGKRGELRGVILLQRIEGLQRFGVLHQRITADFTDTFRPGEGHRHFHLFLDEVQQIRHALLSVGRQGVQVSAAQ